MLLIPCRRKGTNPIMTNFRKNATFEAKCVGCRAWVTVTTGEPVCAECLQHVRACVECGRQTVTELCTDGSFICAPCVAEGMAAAA